MTKLYVIVDYGTSSSVLGLHSRSADDARQAIGWQRRGGFTEPMHICTYDKAAGEFVSVETGQRFRPERGAFTESAFAAFLARLAVEG